ncbi:MAG: hypothetical protein H6714_05765 [Myxococcales bacterium]|nr:hypothetical protein [Myxococcales bacterium]
MALSSVKRTPSPPNGRMRLTEAQVLALAARCGGATILRVQELTAYRPAANVTRIATELGVIDVSRERWVLIEVAPGWSAQEVQAVSGVPLWAGPDLAEVAIG